VNVLMVSSLGLKRFGCDTVWLGGGTLGEDGWAGGVAGEAGVPLGSSAILHLCLNTLRRLRV